jgi:hypothetical protein
MRKFVWALLFCLALSAVLAAAADGQATCTDSDNGGGDDAEPYIGIRGSVTYGIMEKFDTCISAEGGYHYENSSWIREYYCANVSEVVQRTSKDYDCTRYGYTMCQDGKCIGKAGGPSNTTKRASTGPSCGNKVVDAGEQCDPPDKICYLNDNIGICTRPNAQGFGGCQCKLYKGGETTTTETTQTVAPAPVTPPPAATPPPAQVTPPPAAATPPVVQPPAQTTAPAETEKERAPLPTELDNSNGVGITRGITNAVKSFFKWIGSWFG